VVETIHKRDDSNSLHTNNIGSVVIIAYGKNNDKETVAEKSTSMRKKCKNNS